MSGLRLEGLTVDDVLNNMQYYYDLFIEHRKLGFVELHPTREQQSELVQKFANETLDGCGPLWDVTHPHLETTLAETPDDFLIGHWHMDNTVHEWCPDITSMHMHTWKGETGKGSTVLVDLEDLYQKCPQRYKDYLQNIMVHHRSGANKTAQTDELHDGSHHPGLRTHPITGNTCLFYTGPECDPSDGSSELFDEYKQWMRDGAPAEASEGGWPRTGGQLYLLENQFVWDWSEGDFLIWDNTCIVHGFYGGWVYEERVFDKMEGRYSKPYYLGPQGKMWGGSPDSVGQHLIAKDAPPQHPFIAKDASPHG